MNNNPKIVVFKLKELIYTGIFILLGILLIILFICMFKSDKDEKPSASAGEVNALAENPVTTVSSENATNTNTKNNNADNNAKGSSADKKADKKASDEKKVPEEKSTSDKTYSPGVYTSSLMLNNSSLEIEVCVDVNRINSISIKNMDEAITTMYPLMQNSMNDLENQIVNSQSLENITYTDDCRYTYMILLDAISQALSKAAPK